MNSDDDLRKLVSAYRWFHSIKLRDGIITTGKKSPELLKNEEECTLGCIDLKGRTLLDIGAWNGYWSVASSNRGAIVSAMDYNTWINPVWKGRETFDLVCSELGLEIPAYTHDAQKPFPFDVQFDVVLFMGVLYHMKNPIPVFEELRRITKTCLILETHQNKLETTLPVMVFYPGSELNNDASNWWGPNRECVFSLLKLAGFKTVMYQDHPIHGKSRGIFHAFVDKPEEGASSNNKWTQLR